MNISRGFSASLKFRLGNTIADEEAMRLISYMNCETAVQMSCLKVNGKLYLQSLQDGRHTAATIRQRFYLNNLVKQF